MTTTRAMELKENTVIVVLGASGDLAKKKTVCCFVFSFRCATNLLTTSSSIRLYSVS